MDGLPQLYEGAGKTSCFPTVAASGYPSAGDSMLNEETDDMLADAIMKARVSEKRRTRAKELRAKELLIAVTDHLKSEFGG